MYNFDDDFNLDSKFMKYNKSRAIGIYYLPFEIELFQTAISLDPNSFFIVTYNKLFQFSLNSRSSSYHLVIKSMKTDMKESFL